ncbi:MAG: hypothetical protein HFH83_06955 [Lachnospiraceae bacterium]|nr:hypothetical protein [Lachnospiraceae bacterium]
MKEITKLEKILPSDFTLCGQSFFTQKNARTAFFSWNYSSAVMKEITKLEKTLHQVYIPAAMPAA